MIQNGIKSSTENTELPLQIIKLSFPHKKRKKRKDAKHSSVPPLFSNSIGARNSPVIQFKTFNITGFTFNK